MTKTLLVTYLPHGEDSKTKLLVAAFLETLKGLPTELETVDLLESMPDHFDLEKTAAYYKRNLGGATLTAVETALLAKMDAMAHQFLDADTIVLAHPVHNFSLPGVFKLYIDSIAQWGVTSNVGPDASGFPMTGKKMMILSTSMGDYTPGTPGEASDFTYRFEKHLFGTIMKFGTVEILAGSGMYGSEEEKLAKLAPVIEKVKAVTKAWYSASPTV